MKTIENLNITSISFRTKNELYGTGKHYLKRINVPLDESFNERLKLISKEIGIKPTEIIRQGIELIINSCEELINENDY